MMTDDVGAGCGIGFGLGFGLSCGGVGFGSHVLTVIGALK